MAKRGSAIPKPLGKDFEPTDNRDPKEQEVPEPYGEIGPSVHRKNSFQDPNCPREDRGVC
jgi:hypothetical protein